MSAGAICRVAVAVFDPEVDWRSGEAAAPDDAPCFGKRNGLDTLPGRRALGMVSVCAGVVRCPLVVEELPNIACHIEEAVAIGWVGVDPGSGAYVVAEVGAGFIWSCVAPREKYIGQPTARGVLPLGFRWEALAFGAAVEGCGVPVHIDDGMVGFCAAGVSSRPVHQIVAVVEFPPDVAWLPKRVGLKESFELVVGHQVFVEVEIADHDGVAGNFVVEQLRMFDVEDFLIATDF